MILHLLTDEKFTDYAIEQFSAPEMMSEFVLVPSNNMMEHVKLIDHCTIIRQNSKEFKELLTRLGQYSGIVLHGLFWGKWQQPILERVPDNVKVAWHFWGGDIYARRGVEKQFLAPLTKFVCNIRSFTKKQITDNAWEISYPLFHKIDYCLTSIREEYEFAIKYTQAPIKFLWYTCYNLEDTIGQLIEAKSGGCNIMIGNSAAEWNNHLDIFWHLIQSRIYHRPDYNKIIIPLSYGSQWVKNIVSQIGKILFGNRLQVLDTFIPRDNYNALMLSCSTMIIGYYEPAAQGNIITALWLGMRVYLSEKSMTFHFFKRIGVLVFSMESELKIYRNKRLSESEISINKKILTNWYGKKHVMEAIQDVVKALQ